MTWQARIFVFAFMCSITAADDKSVARRDVTVDDYFTQASVTDAVISPDGKQVAYIDTRWEPPRETRNSDLWLVPTAGGLSRRLTFEFGSESSPQWSPDGSALYYLASRKRDDGKYAPYNDKPQIWRMKVESGDVLPISRVEEGVNSFQVSHDGRALYYSVSKDANKDEWKGLQDRYGKLTYGHGKRRVSELWRLNLSTWRTERIFGNDQHIHQFSVSPNERRVALITADDDEAISQEGFSQITIHDLDEGKTTTLPDDLWRKQVKSPYGWLMSPAWSSDGTRLVFSVSFDGYPTELIVAQWAETGEPQIWQLTRPEGTHADDSRLVWSGREDLLFTGRWHARKRVFRIHDVNAGTQGKTEEVTPGDVVVAAFSVAEASGQVALVKSDPTHTEDVFLVNSPAGSYQRLTEVNPQMRQWKLPQVTLTQWEGADGDSVEGVLELPPDYRKGDKLPLVLEIHGGPTADTPYCLRYWVYGDLLFAAKGYARLSPNYHGSMGYGDEFMRKLVGRENDIEVKDLLTGVDDLIKRGIADPGRLAVMGWSNGGFLTNAVVTADQRFKAASCGAGVLDQFLQWGIEDTPGHVINFMAGKLPWEAAENYRKASPVYQLNKVKTPMLIHVGENDARVPAAHSRTLHRALQRYLKVPAQLVVYPGEGHTLNKLEHRRAKMEWDHAWFDHHVLGKPIPDGK